MSYWAAIKPPAFLTLLNSTIGQVVVGLTYAVIMRGSQFDPRQFVLFGVPPLLGIDLAAASWAGFRVAARSRAGTVASALAGAAMAGISILAALPFLFACYGTHWSWYSLVGLAAALTSAAVLGGYIGRRRRAHS